MINRILPLSALSLMACAACVADAPANKERPPVREFELDQPAAEAITKKDPLPAALLESLQADAVKRTSVTADQVTVLGSERVTWPNGALGCPQPGRMYTQALVPGYRVSLRAGRKVLVYHASESGALVVCPRGSRRDPATETVAQ
jgi:hypothetical protein